jgi:hypothetical protein
MMDEISNGFFWIPDFRHIIVSKSGPQICTARKFVPPANLPGKGPAEGGIKKS